MEVRGQLHAPATLPQGKSLSTQRTGSRVGSRTELEAVVKRRITVPAEN